MSALEFRRKSTPQRREAVNQVETGRESIKFEKQFDRFLNDFKVIAASFFPRESQEFKKPEWFSIETSYRDNVGLDTKKNTKIGRWVTALGKKNFLSTLNQKSTRALFATAMIRTVDDFVDDVLWPRIDEYDPEDLRFRFNAFLQESLHCAKQFDPSIPDQIIELPKLELELELNPTQENFDKNIVGLFNRKSFDIRYIERLQGLKVDPSDLSEGILKYTGMCISDFSRDFLPVCYEKDTDFNLRNYLSTYRINPKELIHFLRQTAELLNEHKGSPIFPRELADEYAADCKDMVEDLEAIWHKHQNI